MKSNVVNFLRCAVPFLAVIALWRFAVPVWNPAGILAIIPIFYCTFVRPVKWFAGFAALFCFLIDYNMNLPLFWTAMYCVTYAVNGFQNYFDVGASRLGGAGIFAIWFAVACIIRIVLGATVDALMSGIWIFAWVCAMYMPIVALIHGVRHD